MLHCYDSITRATLGTAIRAPVSGAPDRFQAAAEAPAPDQDTRLTRIGLLTPYDGSNLGDGAIQTAVIENLRRREPGVALLGITLDPSDTTARHGIPAFPITGLSVTSYSEAMRRSIGDGAQAESHRKAAVAASTPSRGDFLRKGVKAIPLVGSTLRFLRRKWQAARQIPAEVRHLTQSYRIVRELDLLLVSGGGQLDEEFGGPWGHPYALFRWAMLARLAGTPFAIASVGVGYLNRPLSRFFLRHALASAEYRS
ncbi:MAG TPA: polysaccharide pyruvyl transferase family protein, partial [Gemmatimonadales bacterium]|nr:polysaccharide pyruvyl transferase family protein [Gemmatimonadales bacterium]